ncbi:MAG: DUF362 domain-containing protein [Lachnospiraceae bacterium]|nr:DUF362 domain-containing protein [Lachnospiraceae bacterium]MBD5511132.1 DUF362 domain-containing protein [Lachnospiraceae bacterium]
MTTNIYIEHASGAAYPQWDAKACYGPDAIYPEFSSESGEIVLSQENKVYEMVRNTIAGLGMDSEHFGTCDWNPFQDFIAQGETVLIKPNMVCHYNGDKRYGTDCLVTHPAIVRAVLDYVVLALNGSGRIILADAPVQSCDFEVLVKELHYDGLVDYFQNNGISVELMDLRQLDEVYLQSLSHNACFTAKNEDVTVSIGEDSAFCSRKDMKKTADKLRITNYLPEHMREYHDEDKHMYSVAKAVLEADVIINLPKPKTHRKAGMTASLKNMVGCVAKKECLPHHTKGSKAEQGDEYLKKSVFKRWRTALEEKNDRLVAKGRKKSGLIGLVQIFLYKASKVSHADVYAEGSWYGNDTLWRTICDICRVVMYADKTGAMQPKQQRKMLILADMIVSGEGEGPLCPSPKPVGILLGGWEQIAVDKVIAALMGFDSEHFPSIKNANLGKEYRLPDSTAEISSNNPVFHKKSRQEIKKKVVPFLPTSGWKECLEESI